MKLSLLSALAAIAAANASVTSLNDENFAQLTQDKIVFIKFFAPWCGHCKSMAPAWEQVAEEMKGNSNVLIAEVDCTADGSTDICEEGGIQGFPTLKFGDPLFLQDYEGGRDFEEMLDFAKNNLKAGCSPKNLDLCDADEKEVINKFMALSVEEIDNTMEELEAKYEAMDDEIEGKTDLLQAEYDGLMEASEKSKAAAKNADYGLIKGVLAIKSKQ